MRVARPSWGVATIVLDIRLPDLDGYEVCGRLRADPDTAAISFEPWRIASDLEAARAALAEPGTVAWEDLKATLTPEGLIR